MSNPVVIQDATKKSKLRVVGATTALDVAIVDGSGNQVTSFNGGAVTGPLTDAELRAAPVPIYIQNALVTVAFDYIAQTQNATQDIFTYKTGGAGGTTVATITITYTDATKVTISTVVKT